MSQAYKCDVCGDCVDNADNAKAEREVARESALIQAVTVDVYIKVGVDVAHVCNTCWLLVMQKVKQWVIANIT